MCIFPIIQIFLMYGGGVSRLFEGDIFFSTFGKSSARFEVSAFSIQLTDLGSYVHTCIFPAFARPVPQNK